jgi:hypothetical protein
MGSYHWARCPKANARTITLRPLWRIDRLPRTLCLAAPRLGGIVWATIFGLGGYLLDASIHRVAGPAGWALLAVALIVGFVLWRYYKNHEESLLAQAELEMARQHSR